MREPTDRKIEQAATLFLVFAVAKAASLWGRELTWSFWTPLAYLWQDVAVALAFLVFAVVVGRRWPRRLVYGGLVFLAALNVPVVRVLSSPLTAPMLRAARGTLADSIRYHVTIENLVGVALVLAAGIGFPRLWQRPLLHQRLWLAAAIVAALAGPLAASRVDTAGLDRHPLVALIRTSWPRVTAAPMEADWRASPIGGEAGEDLSSLRGVAAGQNVLLVVLESTAARYLRAYGAAEDPTPAFSALAERSLLFENAYAVYPESVKGLVSILASRYPGFDVTADRHASAASPSLATRLTAAGYETALFHSGRFMYLGMDTILSASGFARLEDAGDIGGNRNSSFGIDEAAAVRRVLEWIDARPRGRPFFAAYLPIAGHHPYAYAGRGPFPGETEIGRYRNALHEGDRALGELLEGLRSRGLADSTLVIVLADHGEAFGQRAGNYGHTLALYEENIHVPLVIFIPGVQDAVRRIRRPASLIDTAPTVLDLLGLESPREFHGASLLDGDPRMALFFTDYSLGLLGLRDGCSKFLHELESGRSRIFDICRDPDERVDLAPGREEQAARYRERLQRWSAAEVDRVTRGSR